MVSAIEIWFAIGILVVSIVFAIVGDDWRFGLVPALGMYAALGLVMMDARGVFA